MHTPCVKQRAGGKLWYNTEALAWRSVMSKNAGTVQVAGRLKIEGIYVYIELYSRNTIM